MYYLSTENVLQEYCYSTETGLGTWSAGELDKLEINTAPYSIAAMRFCDEAGEHIRVYCQGQLLFHNIYVVGLTLFRHMATEANSDDIRNSATTSWSELEVLFSQVP